MEYSNAIIELEDSRNYKEAIRCAYDLWNNDKNNDTLLCASLELWLLIFCDNELGADLVTDNDVMALWDRISAELAAKWNTDTKLMFFSGYMLKVGFYLFVDVFADQNVDDIISFGKSLMENAYHSEPNDPVYMIQHIRNQSPKYEDSFFDCRKISSERKNEISMMFDGGGIVNEYFRRIYLV